MRKFRDFRTPELSPNRGLEKFIAMSVFGALICFCPLAKAEDTWVLSQKHFREQPRELQFKYLDKLYAVIAAHELSKGEFENCVSAGTIFDAKPGASKGKRCFREDNECPKSFLSCSPAMHVVGCVEAKGEGAPTLRCYEQITDRPGLVRFLENRTGGPLWVDLTRAANEYCDRFKEDKVCRELRAETSAALPAPTTRPAAFKNPTNARFKTKLPGWLLALSQLATPALARVHGNCTYDEKHHVFYGRAGQITKLAFETHGKPSAVDEYISDQFDKKVGLAKAARKMIKANKDANDSMLARANDVTRRLKNRDLKWLALEESGNSLTSTGGAKGRYQSVAKEEARLRKAGLSAHETQKVLAGNYGANILGWYNWMKEHHDHKQALASVHLKGADNERDYGLETLQNKLNETNKKMSDIRQKMLGNPISGNGPDLTNQALKHIHDNWEDEKKQLNALKDLSNSSHSDRAAKDFIHDYAKSLEEKMKLKKERDDRETAEMKKRDKGMASEVMKGLHKGGNGYATFGSAHKKGVLAHLTAMCINGGNDDGGGGNAGSSYAHFPTGAKPHENQEGYIFTVNHEPTSAYQIRVTVIENAASSRAFAALRSDGARVVHDRGAQQPVPRASRTDRQGLPLPRTQGPGERGSWPPACA